MEDPSCVFRGVHEDGRPIFEYRTDHPEQDFRNLARALGILVKRHCIANGINRSFYMTVGGVQEAVVSTANSKMR